MRKLLRVALAQINSTVGDLSGNAKKISDNIKKARRYKADIIAFPELALTGYPPEDLLLKPQFISDNLAVLEKISRHTSGITVITGFVNVREDNLFNAAAVISEGKIIDIYHKIFLPNYGVFDEHRYFQPGTRFPVYNIAGARIGISICEDIWHREGPARVQALAGAELIININASPYEMGKPELRGKILSERSSENAVMIAYLNAVGGQDELVFDGFSMVYDHEGRLIASGKQFEEDLMVLDFDTDNIRKFRKTRKPSAGQISAENTCAVKKIKIPATEYPGRKPLNKLSAGPHLGREEEVYRALVLGTSDYVIKERFQGCGDRTQRRHRLVPCGYRGRGRHR